MKLDVNHGAISRSEGARLSYLFFKKYKTKQTWSTDRTADLL